MILNASQEKWLRKAYGTRDQGPRVLIHTKRYECVWLVSSLRGDGDMAYGLFSVNRGTPQIGHFSLDDLESQYGSDLTVRWFSAEAPIEDYEFFAKKAGYIFWPLCDPRKRHHLKKCKKHKKPGIFRWLLHNN